MAKLLAYFVVLDQAGGPTNTPELPNSNRADMTAIPAKPAIPQTPPRKRQKARPIKGEERDVPCRRCLNSALLRRSLGECHNTLGASTRCWKCTSGHVCVPIPENMAPTAREFLQALRSNNPQQRDRIERLRNKTKALYQITGLESEREDDNVMVRLTPEGPKIGRKRRRDEDEDGDEHGRRLVQRYIGVFLALAVLSGKSGRSDSLDSLILDVPEPD